MSGQATHPTFSAAWTDRRAILNALELLSSAAMWLSDETVADATGQLRHPSSASPLARAPSVPGVEPLFAAPTATGSDSRAWLTLSPREREVTALMARGCSNRQIAQQLCISIATVERHASNIFNKLGLHSRYQVAAWAIRQHLALANAN